MRKVFVFIAVFCALLSAGCAKKEKPAIAIGPITVTAEEFDSAYAKAAGSGENALSRKEFLDILITRKLVLQEAEALGLSQDPQILEEVQNFWEQSLLKLVLARKINEIALICKVSEQEIEAYYNRHKDSDFQGKGFAEVHDQIGVLLYRLKQQLELQRWTNYLKKKAKVDVDYDLLHISKDK